MLTILQLQCYPSSAERHEVLSTQLLETFLFLLQIQSLLHRDFEGGADTPIVTPPKLS